MPSLALQTIPAAGFISIQLGRKPSSLCITNLSARLMRYIDQAGYGDAIPPNYGFKVYSIYLGDDIPANFQVHGTATDTFTVYYSFGKLSVGDC